MQNFCSAFQFQLPHGGDEWEEPRDGRVAVQSLSFHWSRAGMGKVFIDWKQQPVLLLPTRLLANRDAWSNVKKELHVRGSFFLLLHAAKVPFFTRRSRAECPSNLQLTELNWNQQNNCT